MFKSRFHILSLFVLILLIHVVLGVLYTGYSPGWVGAVLVVYFLILFLGSIFHRWGFYLKSQLRLPLMSVEQANGGIQLIPNKKRVALTFDDGPAAHTDEILEVLEQEGIQATFFVIGKNIEGREETLRKMQQAGHCIGNHSYEHGRHFDWQSSRKMKAEIERTNERIAAVTGITPHLFRPPYGVTNPNLARAVRLTGMKSVGWSIRSFDTMARSERRLIEKISKQLHPGAIILLHDRCAITAAALPELISSIKNAGYSFETVG